MRQENYPSQSPTVWPTLPELTYQATSWTLDGEVRQLSRGTINNRQFTTGKLIWFLNERGLERCGPAELRAFFALSRPGLKWLCVTLDEDR